MENKVFLDMDGVLVDFVGGLHKALGVAYDPKSYPYEASKYDMFEDLCAKTNGQVSMDNLYRACDAVEFWSELDWDPAGQEILETIMSVFDWRDVCICTSPMSNPDAWKGKVIWLNRHLPEAKHITIMTAPKHLLAKPGHILIDDKDTNITNFKKYGGDGFLIPQPWNKGRDKVNTNYIPELREFLLKQRDAVSFFENPCKSIWQAFGC